jgi:hypothetical protein
MSISQATFLWQLFLLSRRRAAHKMSFKPSPPNRRKQSPFSPLVRQSQLMYYQYEVTFSPHVLTPGEKFVLNTIVVVFLTLLLVGMVSYLPQLVRELRSES